VTLRDLERAVYRRLGKNASIPNSETEARIRGFINERHRRLLREFPQLREDTLSFDSIEEEPQYSIPEQGIARINRIWDVDNRKPLVQRSLAWLREVDPEPNSGIPDYWVPMGYMQAHTQPDTADSVFVKSTSASDVNRCYVEGMVSGGDRHKAEVTMTGTTAVDVDSSTVIWEQIDKFYLSEAAVGTVTLHQTSGAGTELSSIAIGDTYAKFISFTLYPTPSSVVSYRCDILHGVSEMANPLDEPLLPEDFHDLIAIGARLDEYEATDDSRRRIAEVEWDEGVKALTSWLLAHPDRKMFLDGLVTNGRSRLGSWFPADYE